MHIYYYVKILTFSCNSFTATDTSECNGEMIRNNIVKSKPNHRQEDPHNIQSEGLTFPHHVVCHGMILCNAEVVFYIIHVWFMTIIIFLIYFLFIRIIFYCDIDMQQNAFVLLCLVVFTVVFLSRLYFVVFQCIFLFRFCLFGHLFW